MFELWKMTSTVANISCYTANEHMQAEWNLLLVLHLLLTVFILTILLVAVVQLLNSEDRTVEK